MSFKNTDFSFVTYQTEKCRMFAWGGRYEAEVNVSNCE